MQIQTKPVADIHPHEKNQRFNNNTVEAVAKSINEFGFQQPIVDDKEYVIICGHTRLLAANAYGIIVMKKISNLCTAFNTYIQILRISLKN